MVWWQVGPPQQLPPNARVEVRDEGNSLYYGAPALQDGDPEDGEPEEGEIID